MERWIREDRDQSSLIQNIYERHYCTADIRVVLSVVLHNVVYSIFINIFQALVKITWRQKRRRKKSRPAKEWHIYFRVIMKRLREVSGRVEKLWKK